MDTHAFIRPSSLCFRTGLQSLARHPEVDFALDESAMLSSLKCRYIENYLYYFIQIGSIYVWMARRTMLHSSNNFWTCSTPPIGVGGLSIVSR